MKPFSLLFLMSGFIFSLSSHAQFIEQATESEEYEAEINLDLGLLGAERPELIEESIVLRGQVMAFEFSQPESKITLNSDLETWELIAPSAVELRRLGWTSKSLFAGEMVEVSAIRLLGTDNQASLKSLTRANGSLLIASLENGDEQQQGFLNIPGGMYGLDNDHAHLQFAYDHMGFSKSLIKFERLSADVLWNAESPELSIVQLDIDVSSLRSGVSDLDDALRGEDFFNFLNFPKIQFKSTQLNFSKWGDLELNGQLEILGITQPVQLTAKLNKAGINPLTQQTTVGISLSGELLRSNWRLDAFLPDIADTIEIQFEGEFILRSPDAFSGFNPLGAGSENNPGINSELRPGLPTGNSDSNSTGDSFPFSQ